MEDGEEDSDGYNSNEIYIFFYHEVPTYCAQVSLLDVTVALNLVCVMIEYIADHAQFVTHWSQSKVIPFSRRHFQIPFYVHFYECTLKTWHKLFWVWVLADMHILVK